MDAEKIKTIQALARKIIVLCGECDTPAVGRWDEQFARSCLVYIPGAEASSSEILYALFAWSQDQAIPIPIGKSLPREICKTLRRAGCRSITARIERGDTRRVWRGVKVI